MTCLGGERQNEAMTGATFLPASAPSAQGLSWGALGAWRSWGAVALAAVTGTLAACGGGGARVTPVVSAPAATGRRSETVDHEPCAVAGGHVESLDTNGDGKPDILRVRDGSQHELCRAVDLNRDGRMDLFEYFDATGAIRRREFSYGDKGEVNAVEIYEAGKLVARSYDTTGQHKIDTWDWFDPGAPVDAKTGRPAHPTRRERDVLGGGVINQWWTWNGDQVSISSDHNGDGKPDPASTVVLGGGDDAGAAGPTSPVAAASGGSAAPGDGGFEGGAP
jgi:hypothetical protein